MSDAARDLSPRSRLARAALGYAERGWHVFPLQPRGKMPLIKGGSGFLAATNDVEKVGAWWRGQPEANVGLWPGQSGLVVIDLDGPEGEATARELGLLAEPTLECRTGREEGGRHLYFRRPDFAVSNASIGKKIDVRADAGYVVLPPSIHPSGREYRWVGKADEIRELPPKVLELLRAGAAGATGGSALAPDQSPARDVVFDEAIGEGGRNNALTRYAGRLLAKGIPEDETLLLVSAVNQAKCKPPLPQSEINTMIAGLAKREAAKRGAAQGLRVVREDEPTPATETPAIPEPAALAQQQIEGARQLLTRDLTAAPRWAWPDLDYLLGPMLPGDLVVVGALMGNGKSTLLMSQMDAFAEARRPTLYIPLEVDPEVCRLRWAAWKLALDVRHVVRQDWRSLPEGSREAVDAVLEEQAESPYIHFATPKRMTWGTLAQWCRWAVERANARCVMIDHFHRLDFGAGASYRVDVTEAARRLKDLGRELGVVMLAAAQLNRSADPVDQYAPPSLARLKESAGIGEEADVAVMLSRQLRSDLPKGWMQDLRLGHLSERDLAEPATMVVTCRKHRLDDSALNRRALLTVENGKLRGRLRYGN